MNCASYCPPAMLSAMHRQKAGGRPVVRQNSAWTEGQACLVSQDDMMALQGRLCFILSFALVS